MIMTELYQKLVKIVSEKKISDDINIRHAYSRNVDILLQGVPDIVIRPKSAQEISEILKVANEEKVPVIPRGAGICEFGGSKPIGDRGIVLDMKSMDNIINLDQDNLIVTVEAGISWGKLNEYLSHYGLYTGCMGPGSGMTASIGGGISHHSVGGGGCAKYGVCTNHLVSLEVVLPTGEIIETGSQANKYSKFSFNRFGNGPDLAGLFSGDNGILGVKTKVSLQVYPRPPFAGYKTFMLQKNTAEASAQIFKDIRRKGIDVYDAFYIPDVVVKFGTDLGVYPLWKNIKRKKGVFFYTVEANSEKELEIRMEQLDRIISQHKVQELGPEISEGNYAKWHYTEQGHWQTYHNLWGFLPAFEPLTAECYTTIDLYPKILADIDKWDLEHEQDMQKIYEVTKFRPIAGSGPIFLIDGNNVELTCGFSTFKSYREGTYLDFIDEVNLTLWKSLLERVTKWGVVWYMMGEIMSRLMVDIDAYHPEFYALMKTIKKTLDPNRILSRGKYYF